MHSKASQDIGRDGNVVPVDALGFQHEFRFFAMRMTRFNPSDTALVKRVSKELTISSKWPMTVLANFESGTSRLLRAEVTQLLSALLYAFAPQPGYT